MKKKRISSQGESPEEVKTGSVASSHQEEEENAPTMAHSGVNPLEKLGEEVERLDTEDVRFGVIMWVDPRNLEISPLNVRREEPERYIGILEASIPIEGVKEPLLVDENKEIIDGSRRWRVAFRHSLRVPVFFKYYGEGHEADEERVLDSIRHNQSEPNTDREIGSAVNDLLKRGSNPEALAKKLGVSPGQITNWTKTIFGDEKPFLERLAQVQYRRLSREEKRQFDKINKSRDMTPYDFASRLFLYKKLFQRNRKKVENAVEKGEYVDLEYRCGLQKKKTIYEKVRVPTELYEGLKNKLKIRKMDMNTWVNNMLERFTSGHIDITQEEYEKYGNSNHAGEDDEEKAS